MTIEEAKCYWSKRLKSAESYSDEHWDSEERHAHRDYIDAMLLAVKALSNYTLEGESKVFKKLKQCPFCGNERSPKIISVAEMENNDSDYARTHFLVVCDFNDTGCGASTGYHYESEEAAADAWNNRYYEYDGGLRCN